MLLGAAAYVLWGGFPLYFPLLEPAGAVEILAQRVLWTAVTMTVVVLVLRRTRSLRALVADRRRFWLMTIAAATITCNWGTYIWGVTSGRVVETSLGYFINPLVTVLMGVLILRERLRPAQWTAMGVAGLAVAVLTWDYGRLPYIALVLAFSFGVYGLVKKQAGAGAVESLTLETALIAPFAAAYVGWLVASGGSNFAAHGVGHAVLFATSGMVTAIPLLCFGAAATRIPLVTLGLLQYLAPILQFALGVLWFREEMSPGRWAGFVLVWLALAIFTYDGVQRRRLASRAELEPV